MTAKPEEGSTRMTDEKKGAAEWLRGIIGEYEANGARSCYAIAKMFGVNCGDETCQSCIIKMMTAIADRIDAEQALPEGVEWPRFEDGLTTCDDCAKSFRRWFNDPKAKEADDAD